MLVVTLFFWYFFLMKRRTPRSTRTDTLVPSTTRFRAVAGELEAEGHRLGVDAVAAPDGRRVLVLEGPALQRLQQRVDVLDQDVGGAGQLHRSEEHTSELQSLMRITSAVFCLKKKTYLKNILKHTQYIYIRT